MGVLIKEGWLLHFQCLKAIRVTVQTRDENIWCSGVMRQWMDWYSINKSKTNEPFYKTARGVFLCLIEPLKGDTFFAKTDGLVF